MQLVIKLDLPFQVNVKRQKTSSLTPEDLLIKKEKNRLRSKAYRERRKLQFQSLQEQVILARLEADIAKKVLMVISQC